MEKIYKIRIPQDKKACNIKTLIKDDIIEVRADLRDKWKPKQGDICYTSVDNGKLEYMWIHEGGLCQYIAFNHNNQGWDFLKGVLMFQYYEVRPATYPEQQIFFNLLAKEGKMWDSDIKKVVNCSEYKAETGGERMTRIIKFRAKTLLEEKWVYGTLSIHKPSFINKKGSVFISNGSSWYQVDPVTAGQFTGCGDIYEGDIVKLSVSEDSIGIVRWNNETAAFVVQMMNSSQFYPLCHEYKVIGNIHDNPELLKGNG